MPYDMFIEETIRKISEEDLSGYYRPLRAMEEALQLGYVPLIYWIIGARRIGKTDFFLQLACRLFLDHGVQTMWIRNKQVELSEPGFYNDFLNDAKHFGWCPEDWYSDASGVWTADKEQIIKWQSLSTFSNRRGAAHPDVYMMIYDEFIPESRDYPRRPTNLASCAMKRKIPVEMNSDSHCRKSNLRFFSTFPLIKEVQS